MKSLIEYIGFAAIPAVLTALLSLALPNGVPLSNFRLVFFISIILFILCMIVSPVYLIILSKHYMVTSKKPQFGRIFG